MTNEEAKEILIEKFVKEESKLQLDDGHTALAFAISALARQIPKKPINIQKPLIRWGLCPICKGKNDGFYLRPNRVTEAQKFCSDCGQALDWSEDNE